MIRLRFVSGKDAVSLGIRAQTRSDWSHVEAVTPDGLYVGAHADGGVQARTPGYDAEYLAKDLLLDLGESAPGQAEAFYGFLSRHIGEPYDFGAIFDFAIPGVEVHEAQHVICSALMTLGLRQCGFFATPLSEPAHRISPRDLLLIVSARVPLQGARP